MAADFKMQVARFVADTVSSTQDFTISGFGTVEGALVFVTSAVSNATITDDCILSYGQWGGNTGEKGNLSSIFFEDGTANTNTWRRQTDETFIVILDSAGAIDADADVTALVTDGIRVTWNTNPPVGYLITVVFFGGTDTSCEIDAATFGATTSGQDNSAVGLQADAMLHMHQGDSTLNQTNQEIRQGYGITASNEFSVAQACRFISGEDNNSTSRNRSSVTSGRFAKVQSDTGSDKYRATKYETTDDGYLFDTTSSASSEQDYFFGIEIDGGAAVLGVFHIPLSTGESVTPFPGKPSGVLYITQTDFVTRQTGVDTGWGVGFGMVGDDGVSFSLSVQAQNGQSTSNANSVVNTTAIHQLNTTASVLYSAAHVGFEDGGHRMNWTTVDGNPRVYIGIAFYSNVAAAGLARTPRLRRL